MLLSKPNKNQLKLYNKISFDLCVLLLTKIFMSKFQGKPGSNFHAVILFSFIIKHSKTAVGSSNRNLASLQLQFNFKNYENRIHTFAFWQLRKTKLMRFKNSQTDCLNPKYHVHQQHLVRNREIKMMIISPTTEEL